MAAIDSVYEMLFRMKECFDDNMVYTMEEMTQDSYICTAAEKILERLEEDHVSTLSEAYESIETFRDEILSVIEFAPSSINIGWAEQAYGVCEMILESILEEFGPTGELTYS